MTDTFHTDCAESQIATLRDIAATLDAARDALNVAIAAAEDLRAPAVALDAAYAALHADTALDAEAWPAAARARLAHSVAAERVHNAAHAATAIFSRLPR